MSAFDAAMRDLYLPALMTDMKRTLYGLAVERLPPLHGPQHPGFCDVGGVTVERSRWPDEFVVVDSDMSESPIWLSREQARAVAGGLLRALDELT